MDLATMIQFMDSKGVATAAQMKEAGFAPALIAYALKTGAIAKLTRGVYCSLDVLEDDFAAVTMRWTRCVLSYASALYLNGLSDRIPSSLDVTVPHGYNPRSLRVDFPDIVVHRVPEEFHSIGIATIRDPMGIMVRCYDAERSLADLLRQRTKEGADPQLLRDAVRGYFTRKTKDLPKLMRTCEALGVGSELQTYLEVL